MFIKYKRNTARGDEVTICCPMALVSMQQESGPSSGCQHHMHGKAKFLRDMRNYVATGWCPGGGCTVADLARFELDVFDCSKRSAMVRA